MSKIKPIFIIELPKNMSPNIVQLVIEDFHQSNAELKKDYHVLFSIGKEEGITYKCFNSPYTPEEYTKLEILTKEIQEYYVSKKNRRLQ